MIKRGILFLIGVAIEAGALWALCHYTGKRIRWSNTSIYIVFAIGFLTAHWLLLWNKLMSRLFFHKKSNASEIATQSATPPVNSPVAQPAQAPIESPTLTPAPEAAVTPVADEVNTVSTATPAPPNVTPMRTTHMAPPVKMTVQNNAILNVNPSNPEPMQTSAPTTPQSGSFSTTSLKDQDIEDLAKLEPDLDMMSFKHVALEGKIIDLVYSSDDVAVLCKIFSDDHTWIVDTTQAIEECTWTDETGNTIQPCKNLLLQEAALKKMESDALIYPTFVMVRGTIQNYPQIADYLLQNEINLVQYENDSMPELKDLRKLLKDKFSLFPGEEEIFGDQENTETPQEGTQDG